MLPASSLANGVGRAVREDRSNSGWPKYFSRPPYLEAHRARGQTHLLRRSGEAASSQDCIERAQEREFHEFSSSVVQQKVAFSDRSTLL
jgi:hypothetical protein